MIKTHFMGWLLIFALAVSACSSGNVQSPVVGTPTTPPDEYESFPTVIASNSATVPVTWAGLNLTGRLVHNIGAVDAANNYIVQIRVLDLVTGYIAVVYAAPINASIYYISVSPDGRQVIMSYSPPLRKIRTWCRAYTSCHWMAPNLRSYCLRRQPRRINILRPNGRRMESIFTILM